MVYSDLIRLQNQILATHSGPSTDLFGDVDQSLRRQLGQHPERGDDELL